MVVVGYERAKQKLIVYLQMIVDMDTECPDLPPLLCGSCDKYVTFGGKETCEVNQIEMSEICDCSKHITNKKK